MEMQCDEISRILLLNFGFFNAIISVGKLVLNKCKFTIRQILTNPERTTAELHRPLGAPPAYIELASSGEERPEHVFALKR